ncbi:hypothetical protein B7486_34015 [cyanobacterium TDX16]|nr:hypothetical protein B7486_34015 [cyanobacterium TDX16]
MKFKFPIFVLVASVTCASVIGFQNRVGAQNTNRSQVSPQNTSNQATTFVCVRSGNGFATVAARGNQRSAPMITWQRQVSAEYTPQERCQLVSQKLTKAVAANGGRLSNLLLTTGIIKNETVICYVNSGASCDTSNTLFTLSPENAKNPGAALANLLRFGQRADYSAIRESASGEGETTPNGAIDMEAAVEEAFSAGYESAGTGASEASPVQQLNAPTNGSRW